MKVVSHDPFQHRDCVMGVEFVLDSIRNYPGKRLPDGLAKLRPAFQKLEATLEVGRMSSGALRDIDATIRAVTEGGGAFDSEAPEAEKRSGWLKMWFCAVLAFEDALNTCPAWVEPCRDLWLKAANAVEKVSGAYRSLYPKEHHEACRIWCAHASPHAHPELDAWLQ